MTMDHRFASALLVFLSVSSTPAVWSYKTGCPSSYDIRPCNCRNSQSPAITCRNMKSADDLKPPLSGCKDYSIDSLVVQSSNLGVVPSDLFRGTSITNISLVLTNIRMLGTIFRPPFLGLEGSLETLTMSNCFVDEKWPLTLLPVSHLHKLRFLRLEGNKIPSIYDDWFENGPYNLMDLLFEGNNVREVGPNAFSPLKNLRKFALSGNKIAEVVRTMLPPSAKKLRYIDLSDNEIQKLPEDMFLHMPLLKEVLLNGNEIAQIVETVWNPVWHQLSHVDFSSNPTACDSSLKWVYKARLPPTFEGTCATPPKLKERPLTNLTLETI